jgi:hypothetical protein
MRFAIRWRCAAILLCGCLCGGLSFAEQSQSDQAHVRVLVYNNAHVSAIVMSNAQVEAGRIFAAAGVRLTWENCWGGNEPAECGQEAGPDELVVHIIPKGKGSGDSVYGVAFPSQDDMGTYADVFFNRIETAHMVGIFTGDTPLLLGAIIAHEIGHLLLGAHAHSWVGIMTPEWSKATLQLVGMGSLLFNRDQAALMRNQIRKRTLGVNQVARTSASITPGGEPLRCHRPQPAGMPALPRLQSVKNCERHGAIRPSAGEESTAPRLRPGESASQSLPYYR